jgi:polysaccharide biosynthesis/export protein
MDPMFERLTTMKKYTSLFLITLILACLSINFVQADESGVDTLPHSHQNIPAGSVNEQLLNNTPLTFSEDYPLGAEDVINIHVWRHNDLTFPNLIIRKDGTISYPFTGEINVTGLTCRQLEEKLRESLKPYIRDPKVSVNIARGRAFRISIMGQVFRPGTFDILSPEITITEALAQAGGTKPEAAIHRSLLQRGNETITVDLQDVLRDGNIENNIIVREGDIIIIPEMNQRIAVLGEVARPGVYNLKEGDTLIEAISAAGWFSGKARVSRIEIIRRGVNGTQERIDVNFRDIKNKKDKDLLAKFALQSGDMVYVPELKGISFDHYIRSLSGLYMLKNFFPGL